MGDILPYHTTASEYTNEQTYVYHDRSDCPEGRKINPMHSIDGAGGRRRCPVCERLDTAENSKC